MYLAEISKIKYNPSSKGYIVILKELDNNNEIPIVVGSAEAQSISLAHEGIESPRPMTHDLFVDTIAELNGSVKHISIKRYKNGTYFANIAILSKNAGIIDIDSRPSDAIAIALKAMAPIYVSKNVIESTANKSMVSEQYFVKEKATAGVRNRTGNYNLNDIIVNLNSALTKAVDEENYETAARIRDRIKNLKTRKV